MTDKTTGGELVVRILASLGVRHIFGVPGGQTLAITDALYDNGEITFVTAHHEGGAAAMADAYGRLTGRPGICLATTGPGATNLLTGVGGALRDSSPALIITCNNASGNLDKDEAQAADHVSLFRPLTKHSRLVAHGANIVQAVEESFIRAQTGCPGPVHLDFTRDAVEEDVEDPPDIPEVHPLLSLVEQRPEPDPGAVAAAARRIAGAQRPVLWLGNGCSRSGAGEAALALAEQMAIPVITTFNGIGCVPTGHRLVFGALSRMGTSLSSRVLAEADLVIAVGNSLNAISTRRWTIRMPEIIQIDIDPATVGRYYGTRTLGVVADARAALTRLREAAAAPDGAGAAPEGRYDWLEELTRARASWQADVAAQPEEVAPAGSPAPPASVVRELRKTCPDETLLIPDAGNPGVWSYLWEIRQPGSYLKPVGFGNMGFAVPAAIAAVAARPAAPVLALVGDGSLGMSMAELETLARVGGRVCVVVLDDGGYGNIRQEQLVKYGPRPIGVDFGPIDYAQVARGLGLPGERISDPTELSARVRDVLSGDSPALIAVPIDPTVNAWTFPAFAQYEPED